MAAVVVAAAVEAVAVIAIAKVVVKVVAATATKKIASGALRGVPARRGGRSQRLSPGEGFPLLLIFRVLN